MKKKISAFLGPTNTGKTYAAIQSLLKYKTGVIGFPLRLLARENFELAKKFLPESKIALITGEEKIIPKNANYFFCTVESIPENLQFDFVAIDEVQLASDYERGYIFTKRILNNRGLKETLFLGSRSIEKILLKIYPDIQINKKPRMSKLSYIGYKNLTRLPKRSAVIAFSQIDVYEIANKIKQSHGGVSVVLGALSPDVRNAQVKLFEDGKVDYIVATDAIGMGLNLNIKNIFFSSIKKFDGLNGRYLTYDEIAQIAGRAGRHFNDGYFGTTCDLKSLRNDIINFVENHEFTEIKKIYWRNNKLNFSSPSNLLKSLSIRPNKKYLRLKNDGNDHRYVKIFLEENEFKKNLTNPIHLKKLWEICSVPDYSKNLDEYHTRFLRKIFFYLVSQNRCIPDEWVKQNLNEINRFTKKIPELNHKLSQLRTWSFISFKREWIKDGERFQKKVKKLELQFALKLHKELMIEFIGEYKNFELENSTNLIQTNHIVRFEKKKICFGKEIIGCRNGLKFDINQNFKKSKSIFNNKILKKSLTEFSLKIKDEFLNSSFVSFEFKVDGTILWKKDVIGCFLKDKSLTKPRVEVFLDKFFLNFEKVIKFKILNFLNFLISKELPFINKLQEIKKNGACRAINFSVLENLGHCERKNIDNFLKQLTSEELKEYRKYGFKVGINFFYFNSNKLSHLKQMLINIFFKYEMKKFIDEPIFCLNLRNSVKNTLNFYKKLGFYKIQINKEHFLVDHQYFESLSRKVYFFKKQKYSFLPNNKFEKFFFKNPKKIYDS